MKTITIEIEDLEWQALEHEIVDPLGWVQNVVKVKARKVTNRIVQIEQARLIEDPTVEIIPATVEGILQSHFSQPGYVKATARPDPADPALP